MFTKEGQPPRGILVLMLYYLMKGKWLNTSTFPPYKSNVKTKLQLLEQAMVEIAFHKNGVTNGVAERKKHNFTRC